MKIYINGDEVIPTIVLDSIKNYDIKIIHTVVCIMLQVSLLFSKTGRTMALKVWLLLFYPKMVLLNTVIKGVHHGRWNFQENSRKDYPLLPIAFSNKKEFFRKAYLHSLHCHNLLKVCVYVQKGCNFLIQYSVCPRILIVLANITDTQ